MSRRQVLAVSGTGLIASAAGTAAVPARAAGRAGSRGPDDGTPEQIHLTWGDDPARSVVVSWASPGRAVRPRVRIGQRVIPAEERGYTDGLPVIVPVAEFRDIVGAAVTATLSGADPATELKKAHEQFRPILERSEKS